MAVVKGLWLRNLRAFIRNKPALIAFPLDIDGET